MDNGYRTVLRTRALPAVLLATFAVLAVLHVSEDATSGEATLAEVDRETTMNGQLHPGWPVPVPTTNLPETDPIYTKVIPKQAPYPTMAVRSDSKEKDPLRNEVVFKMPGLNPMHIKKPPAPKPKKKWVPPPMRMPPLEEIMAICNTCRAKVEARCQEHGSYPRCQHHPSVILQKRKCIAMTTVNGILRCPGDLHKIPLKVQCDRCRRDLMAACFQNGGYPNCRANAAVKRAYLGCEKHSGMTSIDGVATCPGDRSANKGAKCVACRYKVIKVCSQHGGFPMCQSNSKVMAEFAKCQALGGLKRLERTKALSCPGEDPDNVDNPGVACDGCRTHLQGMCHTYGGYPACLASNVVHKALKRCVKHRYLSMLDGRLYCQGDSIVKPAPKPMPKLPHLEAKAKKLEKKAKKVVPATADIKSVKKLSKTSQAMAAAAQAAAKKASAPAVAPKKQVFATVAPAIAEPAAPSAGDLVASAPVHGPHAAPTSGPKSQAPHGATAIASTHNVYHPIPGTPPPKRSPAHVAAHTAHGATAVNSTHNVYHPIPGTPAPKPSPVHVARVPQPKQPKQPTRALLPPSWMSCGKCKKHLAVSCEKLGGFTKCHSVPEFRTIFLSCKKYLHLSAKPSDGANTAHFLCGKGDGFKYVPPKPKVKKVASKKAQQDATPKMWKKKKKKKKVYNAKKATAATPKVWRTHSASKAAQKAATPDVWKTSMPKVPKVASKSKQMKATPAAWKKENDHPASFKTIDALRAKLKGKKKAERHQKKVTKKKIAAIKAAAAKKLAVAKKMAAAKVKAVKKALQSKIAAAKAAYPLKEAAKKALEATAHHEEAMARHKSAKKKAKKGKTKMPSAVDATPDVWKVQKGKKNAKAIAATPAVWRAAVTHKKAKKSKKAKKAKKKADKKLHKLLKQLKKAVKKGLGHGHLLKKLTKKAKLHAFAACAKGTHKSKTKMIKKSKTVKKIMKHIKKMSKKSGSKGKKAKKMLKHLKKAVKHACKKAAPSKKDVADATPDVWRKKPMKKHKKSSMPTVPLSVVGSKKAKKGKKVAKKVKVKMTHGVKKSMKATPKVWKKEEKNLDAKALLKKELKATPQQWKISKRNSKKVLKAIKSAKLIRHAKKADKKIVKKVASASADSAVKKELEHMKEAKIERAATPKGWKIHDKKKAAFAMPAVPEEDSQLLEEPHTAAIPPSPEEELLEIEEPKAVNGPVMDAMEFDDDIF
jgi:hypothetical protein